MVALELALVSVLWLRGCKKEEVNEDVERRWTIQNLEPRRVWCAERTVSQKCGEIRARTGKISPSDIFSGNAVKLASCYLQNAVGLTQDTILVGHGSTVASLVFEGACRPVSLFAGACASSSGLYQSDDVRLSVTKTRRRPYTTASIRACVCALQESRRI